MTHLLAHVSLDPGALPSTTKGRITDPNLGTPPPSEYSSLVMASRVLALCAMLLPVCLCAATCPPANFTTVEQFSLATYISRPWFSVQQAANSYQPRENLYCVRAEYKADPSDASRLLVFNQGRRGSTSGALQGTNMLLSAIVKVRTSCCARCYDANPDPGRMKRTASSQWGRASCLHQRTAHTGWSQQGHLPLITSGPSSLAARQHSKAPTANARFPWAASMEMARASGSSSGIQRQRRPTSTQCVLLPAPRVSISKF